MKKRKIKCTPAQELRWGILTQVTLPGGGKLGFYEALHPRPKAAKVAKVTKTTKITKVATVAKKKTTKARA